MSPVIRGIDLGYGMTKLTKSYNQFSGQITPASFPSIAATYCGREISTEEGSTNRRNTITVKVGETIFEVGPEARKALGGNSDGRNRETEYPKRDQYMALTLGALGFMDIPLNPGGEYVIDVLVVGLPISTFDEHRSDLKEKMTGAHKVMGKNILVKNVLVVHQPRGAYAEYAVRTGSASRMKNEVTLVADAGYFTFDWLWMDGNTPVAPLSDAANDGGMAGVLERVCEQIYLDEKDRKSESGALLRPELTLKRVKALTEKIDECLRTGNPIQLSGIPILKSTEHYIKVGRKRAEDSVADMMQTLGDRVMEINNIVEAGGGSHIYRDVLQANFPGRNILSSSEPIYANVKGYVLLGAQWAGANLRG